jgi:hypothetical protein
MYHWPHIRGDARKLRVCFAEAAWRASKRLEHHGRDRLCLIDIVSDLANLSNGLVADEREGRRSSNTG